MVKTAVYVQVKDALENCRYDLQYENFSVGLHISSLTPYRRPASHEYRPLLLWSRYRNILFSTLNSWRGLRFPLWIRNLLVDTMRTDRGGNVADTDVVDVVWFEDSHDRLERILATVLDGHRKLYIRLTA